MGKPRVYLRSAAVEACVLLLKPAMFSGFLESRSPQSVPALVEARYASACHRNAAMGAVVAVATDLMTHAMFAKRMQPRQRLPGVAASCCAAWQTC